MFLPTRVPSKLVEQVFITLLFTPLNLVPGIFLVQPFVPLFIFLLSHFLSLFFFSPFLYFALHTLTWPHSKHNLKRYVLYIKTKFKTNLVIVFKWYFQHEKRCNDRCTVNEFIEDGLLRSIPVVVRSMAWVCGRPLAGIACSNPAGGMDVCLLWMLCVVHEEDSATSWSLVQRGTTGCVCVWMWSGTTGNIFICDE